MTLEERVKTVGGKLLEAVPAWLLAGKPAEVCPVSATVGHKVKQVTLGNHLRLSPRHSQRYSQRAPRLSPRRPRVKISFPASPVLTPFPPVFRRAQNDSSAESATHFQLNERAFANGLRTISLFSLFPSLASSPARG